MRSPEPSVSPRCWCGHTRRAHSLINGERVCRVSMCLCRRFNKTDAKGSKSTSPQDAA